MNLKQMKSELKSLALKIRQLKRERKPGYEGVRTAEKNIFFPNMWEAAAIQCERERRIVRVKHLGYCLARGVPVERIECPKDNNKLQPTEMAEAARISSELQSEMRLERERRLQEKAA